MNSSNRTAPNSSSIIPAADTGIYSAGLGSRDTTKPGDICRYPEHRKYRGYLREGPLYHRRSAQSQYRGGNELRQLLQSLRDTNPNLVVLGLSATPYRLSSGLLYEGKDRLFECLYEVDIMQLIHDGYLCPVISKGGVDKIDVVSTPGNTTLRSALVTDNTTHPARRADDKNMTGKRGIHDVD